jgi:hypothetical protein
VLHLRVRRFFCTAAECARRIFAEQIHGLTTRYGRISAQARGMLESVPLALGGRAGARLSDRVGLGIGRTSLLRLIRALPMPAVPPVTASICCLSAANSASVGQPAAAGCDALEEASLGRGDVEAGRGHGVEYPLLHGAVREFTIG